MTIIFDRNIFVKNKSFLRKKFSTKNYFTQKVLIVKNEWQKCCNGFNYTGPFYTCAGVSAISCKHIINDGKISFVIMFFDDTV